MAEFNTTYLVWHLVCGVCTVKACIAGWIDDIIHHIIAIMRLLGGKRREQVLYSVKKPSTIKLIKDS